MPFTGTQNKQKKIKNKIERKKIHQRVLTHPWY